MLELIQASNIVYLSQDNNSTLSFFDPGSSKKEKRLSISITSEIPFYKTKMKLKLIATKNPEYVMTKLAKPMTVFKKIDQASYNARFDFIGADIPFPFGILHVPTIIDDCSQGLHTSLGNVLEYCFILYVKRCNKKFKIPLNVRYIGCDVVIDFKTERPELVSEPDEMHQIKVICSGDNVLYTNRIHAVTHCQAPKPIVFYYNNP